MKYINFCSFISFTLIIFISGCSSAQNINEAKVNFYANDTEVYVSATNSNSTFKQYVIVDNPESFVVSFYDVPSNIIESMDEYGREFIYKDSVSDFNLYRVDTLKNISNISIKFKINEDFLDSISFRYQVLSKSKRISESSFGKINITDIGKLIEKECKGMVNPVIILYGFSFYQDEIQYSIGGGKIGVYVK